MNSAKVEILSAMVQSNDIIAITETFFNKCTDNELLMGLAKSHQVIRADRLTDIGGKTKNGGAMILIPNMFIIKSKLVFSNGFVEIAGVAIEPLNIIIVVVYAPGDTEYDHFKEAITVMDSFFQENKAYINRIMCGDYNFPPSIVKWIIEEDTIFPVMIGSNDNDTEIAKQRKKATGIFDCAEKYSMEQIVGVPTRKKNILDLIYTNLDSEQVFATVDNSLSDHNMVTANFNISYESAKKPEDIKVLSIKDLDRQEANESLINIKWDAVLENLSPDKQKDVIVDKIK